MSTHEKWVIYSAGDTQFCFNIHVVSRLEQQLRNEGKSYRTIYYRNNEPVRYAAGLGYKVMSRKEEATIVASVQFD
ncbi:hypothetical protein SAMN04488134_102146 [Amphibacillus marinus]|uniref:Uncharacterized protein n=1 Tax=Amphibacillus marinus TaxID=872970 RepID=A0A1H8K3M0_9BACI|nr:hypothetical protein [Amphibacillus marinus]SEN86998.1 hypothetical protein SAMN04488134_102146 [Amphibacillus marinus]